MVALFTSHVAVDLKIFTLKNFMAQLCKPSEYSASITWLLPFLLEVLGLWISYLVIRSIFDPNGATSHSFIRRKVAQEGTKEGIDVILQRA